LKGEEKRERNAGERRIGSNPIGCGNTGEKSGRRDRGGNKVAEARIGGVREGGLAVRDTTGGRGREVGVGGTAVCNKRQVEKKRRPKGLEFDKTST